MCQVSLPQQEQVLYDFLYIYKATIAKIEFDLLLAVN